MATEGPVPCASTTTPPVLVVTLMPASVPASAELFRVTPVNVTVMIPAVRGAVPVNTNSPSVRVETTLYPAVIRAPEAATPGAAVQPDAAVAVKKPVGQLIMIEFRLAAHPTVAWGKLVAMVKVNTGETTAEIF